MDLNLTVVDPHNGLDVFRHRIERWRLDLWLKLRLRWGLHWAGVSNAVTLISNLVHPSSLEADEGGRTTDSRGFAS
jgi:hypothetical protein